MGQAVPRVSFWKSSSASVGRFADTPERKRIARTAVKGFHTVVFVLLSAGVLETLRAGLRGRTSRATGPAIAATIVEGLVLVSNNNHCPLTGLAEELGSEHGEVSDIFLPRWFARHIPSIFSTMFGLGIGCLIEAQSNREHAHN